MTATTDTPTTSPEVPAWLNLDGYCPPDVRDLLAESADEIERLLGAVEEVALRAYGAQIAFEQATGGCALDDHFYVFGHLTGWTRQHAAARRLESLGGIAAGEEWEGGDGQGDPQGWWMSYADRIALLADRVVQS